jgi:hypothetical protein
LPHPGQAAAITTLKSLKLDVPASDAMFSAGPGSDAHNTVKPGETGFKLVPVTRRV